MQLVTCQSTEAMIENTLISKRKNIHVISYM